MLDHHYAGRQPGHDHIHAGALFPDHLHGHEVSHTHGHPHSSVEEQRDGPGVVVVIASHSGAVPGYAYVSGSASQTELSFPDSGETPHYYMGEDGALRQQSFITPPTQPPRV